MASLDSARRLQTGLIGYYIPHRMWVALAAFLALIFWMREDLYVRFMAHASLNGLIIATAVIVIFMAFANAFKVQKAANFLKKLEDFEDTPTEEARVALLKELRTKASFIDTFYLQSILNGYKSGGFLIFDDNTARLVKSKIGQRAGHMRNTVQYLAGVLVMLGLIGTFWGLLETITAVGEAMGGITASFTGGGDTSAGMLSFLQSISKPLKGMGIAFSASLFGLSGSLLGGLLNSFCAKGMDKFIENLGVWIDTRIPVREAKKETSTNPVEIIEQHNATVVRALEGALTEMRRQSQEIFVSMSGVMAHFAEFSQQQQEALKTISGESRINVRLADAMESAVNGLRHEATSIRASLEKLPTVQEDISNTVRLVHAGLQETQQGLLAGQARIASHIGNAAAQQANTNTSLNQMVAAYAAMVNLQEHLLHRLHEMPHANDDSSNKSTAMSLVLEMQKTLQHQLNSAPQWLEISPEQNRHAAPNTAPNSTQHIA